MVRGKLQRGGGVIRTSSKPSAESDAASAGRPLGERSDEALVLAVKERRSRAAFRELYDRTAVALMVFIKRQYGLDQSSAEDVLQETFLKVFRHIASFDAGRGDFRGWCWGIAKNCAIDALRAREKERPCEPGLLHQERDRAQDFVEALANLELIEQVLSRLPPDLQRVLRMRVLEQKTLEEIGACLGVSIATVHRRFAEALAALPR